MTPASHAGRRCRRWMVVLIGLLAIQLIAGWLVSRLTADPKGGLEVMFSRVRVGMTLNEAVGAVEETDYIDAMYIEGKTKSGRSFDSLVVTDRDLPVPQEIEHGELAVEDSIGGEIDIILGSNGIVTGKRIKSNSLVTLCVYRLHQLFGH
jgi:hypothetical protein